jgi:3-hydroxymyristoyl/3-hydroxydecanoyl-(acyl carrier protein) dehydratase
MNVSITLPQQSAMLDAHFPGHPIFPGAALLDCVLHACNAPATCTVTAKFLQPVRPGATLTVRLSPMGDTGAQKFEVLVQEVLVCTGQVKP